MSVGFVSKYRTVTTATPEKLNFVWEREMGKVDSRLVLLVIDKQNKPKALSTLPSCDMANHYVTTFSTFN